LVSFVKQILDESSLNQISLNKHLDPENGLIRLFLYNTQLRNEVGI